MSNPIGNKEAREVIKFARKSCVRCYGTGIMGRIHDSVQPSRVVVVVCDCAVKAYNRKVNHD